MTCPKYCVACHSSATAHEAPKPNVPISVFVTLGAEVHEQMFRSGGQSDAKPSVLSPQTSSVLIYGPTEGMKSRVDLAHPGDRNPDQLCGSAICYHSTTGL
ncbi:hypothetical protein TNCV_3733821 [Trichonephila clavipes]|nr:hypothetical protein TNCV_3733821 [Trichonephila clavipes]